MKKITGQSGTWNITDKEYYADKKLWDSRGIVINMNVEVVIPDENKEYDLKTELPINPPKKKDAKKKAKQ